MVNNVHYSKGMENRETTQTGESKMDNETRELINKVRDLRVEQGISRIADQGKLDDEYQEVFGKVEIDSLESFFGIGE